MLIGTLLMLAGSGVRVLFGQGTTATIEGTVSDASGAAVPDASVTLRNVNTTATETVTTNAQGRYLLTNLGVGEYEIRLSKSGFSNAIRTGVTLTVGSQNVIDFALQV